MHGIRLNECDPPSADHEDFAMTLADHIHFIHDTLRVSIVVSILR